MDKPPSEEQVKAALAIRDEALLQFDTAKFKCWLYSTGVPITHSDAWITLQMYRAIASSHTLPQWYVDYANAVLIDCGHTPYPYVPPS